MSEVTLNLEGLLREVQKELDAQPVSTLEINAGEDFDTAPKKRRRHRKGENEKPTPMQMRYQRQVRDRRVDNDVVEQMSKLAAWTWIPGKDRRDCPGIVDLRDPRLLVMDRFPPESGGRPTQIGLAMHRSSVTKQGVVHYGGPEQMEMFKDFSIRPHFRAGGLCLDSRNEEVFRTALALDQAMELVARGKMEPTTSFAPPPVLFGFPTHYLPTPEWRGPMQEAVQKALHPDSPILRCLQSPGGLILGIVDTKDGFRTISVEKEGNRIEVRVPNYATLCDGIHTGSVTLEGQPLADLPRGNYERVKDITSRYPFKSLEWLERRILDELTEIVSVQEDVYDKQTKTRQAATTTWRCVPSQFVQNQQGRAVRMFLDLRTHLGRKCHVMDNFERDVWSEDPHQVRIEVMQFESRPTAKNLKFGDGTEGKNGTWSADLLTVPSNAAWATRCPQRGAAQPAFA